MIWLNLLNTNDSEIGYRVLKDLLQSQLFRLGSVNS